jgi:hypothetical protein
MRKLQMGDEMQLVCEKLHRRLSQDHGLATAQMW